VHDLGKGAPGFPSFAAPAEVVMKARMTMNRIQKRHMLHEAEGVASGAIAGAVLGASAGPPGILAGVIVGGAAGAIAAEVLDRDQVRSEARTRELDREIGVTEGDIGAPNLRHPPATIGAYSLPRD
jgi:phage tail tape-measure protein